MNLNGLAYAFKYLTLTHIHRKLIKPHREDISQTAQALTANKSIFLLYTASSQVHALRRKTLIKI